MPNKKVSFDFDGVLDLKRMQDYAKELIKNDVDVWICTSRRIGQNFNNKDLFEVALNIGVNPEHIIFTNNGTKDDFLNEKGFIFHIDDCERELMFISVFSDVAAISVRMVGLNDYCNRLLNIK